MNVENKEFFLEEYRYVTGEITEIHKNQESTITRAFITLGATFTYVGTQWMKGGYNPLIMVCLLLITPAVCGTAILTCASNFTKSRTATIYVAKLENKINGYCFDGAEALSTGKPLPKIGWMNDFLNSLSDYKDWLTFFKKFDVVGPLVLFVLCTAGAILLGKKYDYEQTHFCYYLWFSFSIISFLAGLTFPSVLHAVSKTETYRREKNGLKKKDQTFARIAISIVILLVVFSAVSVFIGFYKLNISFPYRNDSASRTEEVLNDTQLEHETDSSADDSTEQQNRMYVLDEDEEDTDLLSDEIDAIISEGTDS